MWHLSCALETKQLILLDYARCIACNIFAHLLQAFHWHAPRGHSSRSRNVINRGVFGLSAKIGMSRQILLRYRIWQVENYLIQLESGAINVSSAIGESLYFLWLRILWQLAISLAHVQNTVSNAGATSQWWHRQSVGHNKEVTSGYWVYFGIFEQVPRINLACFPFRLFCGSPTREWTSILNNQCVCLIAVTDTPGYYCYLQDQMFTKFTQYPLVAIQYITIAACHCKCTRHTGIRYMR